MKPNIAEPVHVISRATLSGPEKCVTEPKVYSILGHNVTIAFSRHENGTIQLEITSLSTGNTLHGTFVNPYLEKPVIEWMIQNDVLYIRDAGKAEGLYDELLTAGIVKSINDYPYARLNDSLIHLVPARSK